MYASRLGNGNGDGDGPQEAQRLLEERAARLKAVMFPPAPPSPGCGPGVGKWAWTEKVLLAPPFNWVPGPKLQTRLMQECQQGWPMYQDEQFRLKISRYVPTVEETAEAFVAELTQLAPAPPTTGPTVVTPPDVLTTQLYIPAPPMPAPSPLPVTSSTPSVAPESLIDKYAEQKGEAAPPWQMRAYLPVDSRPPAQPPAHVLQQEYPLMRQYEEQIDAEIAADVTPPGEVPAAPPEKKGAGIGTVLLLAAPVVLSQIL